MSYVSLIKINKGMKKYLLIGALAVATMANAVNVPNAATRNLAADS